MQSNQSQMVKVDGRVYKADQYTQICNSLYSREMRTPGIGNKKKRFKKLIGWGKKKTNGRKRVKQTTKGTDQIGIKTDPYKNESTEKRIDIIQSADGRIDRKSDRRKK